MRRSLGIERIEANREKVLAWAAAGRPYFWIARQIGLGANIGLMVYALLQVARGGEDG